jgi:hypothetical protein
MHDETPITGALEAQLGELEGRPARGGPLRSRRRGADRGGCSGGGARSSGRRAPETTSGTAPVGGRWRWRDGQARLRRGLLPRCARRRRRPSRWEPRCRRGQRLVGEPATNQVARRATAAPTRPSAPPQWGDSVTWAALALRNRHIGQERPAPARTAVAHRCAWRRGGMARRNRVWTRLCIVRGLR